MIILFTVFFVATRNVKTSIILTGIFIVFTLELFNDKSYNCIIPKNWLKQMKSQKSKENKQKEIQQALYILQSNGIIN